MDARQSSDNEVGCTIRLLMKYSIKAGMEQAFIDGYVGRFSEQYGPVTSYLLVSIPAADVSVLLFCCPTLTHEKYDEFRLVEGIGIMMSDDEGQVALSHVHDINVLPPDSKRTLVIG